MDSFRINLEQHDLLEFKGPDSEKFLQGQLTCDLASLADMQFCEGAACNNKGRVIADFRLLKFADSYMLELAPEMGAILAATLKKFLPFYKSELQQLHDFMVTGLVGARAEEMLLDHIGKLPAQQSILMYEKNSLICVDKSQQRYMLISGKDQSNNSLVQSISQLDQGAYADWQYLDTANGSFHVTPGDSGLYTPQELNFDIRELVSFSKGCYTGQEIVARMHYRGKQDKRLYRLKTDASPEHLNNFKSGEIIDQSNTIRGKVIKAIVNPGTQTIELLAIFNSSPESAQLSLSTDKSITVDYCS